jgi:NADH-quinone oxidoreductase subunit J
MALTLFFLIFAAIAIVSAILVVTARNPVRSVLALVVTFIAVAGTWMLLQAEFLSLVLVVVYVGAVMVLFLFVVMMLDVERAEQKRGFVAYWPFALMVAVALAICLYNLLHRFTLAAPTNTWNLTLSNLQQVGINLFTYQLYPFELAALILLAAMIAAISLTFRGRQKNDKAQVVSRQVKVSAQERLKLVDVDNKGIS